MGHKIGKTHRPRRGSRGFSPRVRSKRHYPRIDSWPSISDKRLLGFAGYKAGMTQIVFIDNSSVSPTKGETVSLPVTIIDVPKIRVAAIRFYSSDNV